MRRLGNWGVGLWGSSGMAVRWSRCWRSSTGAAVLLDWCCGFSRRVFTHAASGSGRTESSTAATQVATTLMHMKVTSVSQWLTDSCLTVLHWVHIRSVNVVRCNSVEIRILYSVMLKVNHSCMRDTPLLTDGGCVKNLWQEVLCSVLMDTALLLALCDLVFMFFRFYSSRVLYIILTNQWLSRGMSMSRVLINIVLLH